MGYIMHHAIVVTSWKKEAIDDAHDKADSLGLLITPVVEGKLNGYRSFLVCPDGSKEGWADSDEGDVQRGLFVEWLRSQCCEDGGSYVDWTEVNYGEDPSWVVRDVHAKEERKPPEETKESLFSVIVTANHMSGYSLSLRLGDKIMSFKVDIEDDVNLSDQFRELGLKVQPSDFGAIIANLEG